MTLCAEGPDIASMTNMLKENFSHNVYYIWIETAYYTTLTKSLLNDLNKHKMYGSKIRKIYSIGKQIIIEFDIDYCIVLDFPSNSYVSTTCDYYGNKKKTIEFRSTIVESPLKYEYISIILKGYVNVNVKSLDYVITNVIEKQKCLCMSNISVSTFSNYICLPYEIAELLMNRKYVIGIGHRYCSEILYASGIHPKTKMKDLTDEQIETLIENMHDIFNRSSKTDMKNDSPCNNYRMLIDGNKRNNNICRLSTCFGEIYYCPNSQKLFTATHDQESQK